MLSTARVPIISLSSVTQVKRLYDAFNEPFRRVPTAKRPQQNTEDVSATAVDERQAPSNEGEGADVQGAMPATKLINREDDTSVREALKALRGKSSKRTPKLQAQTASVPIEEEVVDLQPPATSTGAVNSPSGSIKEDHVILLSD
jgi:hypothetical protein